MARRKSLSTTIKCIYSFEINTGSNWIMKHVCVAECDGPAIEFLLDQAGIPFILEKMTFSETNEENLLDRKMEVSQHAVMQ